MKSGKYSLSMFLAVSMFCSLAAAQQSATTSSATVPRLVNFSGKTTDPQGKAISGIAGVTFAIYKDQYEGAPLWMETQNIQADAKGNYTAQLGSTKPDGLPLDLFSSGDARWLGVTVNSGQEQPRVLLLSVPYALKAADAETVGGLPASAFVLATPPNAGSTSASAPSTTSTQNATPQPLATGTTPVTTGGGTVNKLAKFDANADIANSLIFDNGTNVGIGNTAPATKLDVSGSGTFRGLLTLPATGTGTATGGKNSQPLNLTASAFNSSTAAAVNQNFRWQAEAVSNNTSTASGSLNLLFGSGTASPTETGLKVSNKGVFTFATGQTFPGTGTVTSVGLSAPSSDFNVTGSPVTKSGTLALTWNVVPTSFNTANAIVKRDGSGSFNAGAIFASLGLAGTSSGVGDAVSGSNTGGGIGVHGTSTAAGGSPAIWGEHFATSGGIADGVHGVAHSGGSSGVAGVNLSGGTGVGGYSTAVNGFGVYGQGGSPSGVNLSGLTIGVWGDTGSLNGFGVFGSAAGNQGLDGVHGISYNGFGSGVAGINFSGGDGVFGGTNNGGFAGYFNGDVNVVGNLSKGGGSFKIDHPLDPANKYLYHSFVESPDMMNIYNGNVTTDAQGNAIVALPDWFEVLNRDFRYQLAVIGQFAQAIVSSEIANGQFSIKTDKPNIKVSWQVTGIRHDAWANAHRIPVEEMKPGQERGFYLHPELFGAPPEKSIAVRRHPFYTERPASQSTLRQDNSANH